MKAKLIKKKDGWYNLYDGEIGIGSTYDDLQGYKLSIKNCQAIERGYDLDELLDNITPKNGTTGNISERIGFVKGFQKALELMGDKKFTEEDMKSFTRNYYREIRENTSNLLWEDLADKCMKEHIQSIQQNEWEVEIEMEEVSIGDKYTPDPKPKLDADGCLILKRV